jgi:drug/metabolite transporter (DMT)-like permease
MTTTDSIRGRSLVLAAAVCWSLSTVLTKVALEQMTALDLVGVELAVGVGVVWAVLLARGVGAHLRRWPTFVALGVLEPGLAFVLFDVGLTHIGAAAGALLLASESVLTVVLGWLLLKETISASTAGLVAVGFGGAILIGLDQGGAQTSFLGEVLILASSACAAGYAVVARVVSQEVDSDALTTTGVQLLSAAVLSAPVVLVSVFAGHGHLARIDAAHWGVACLTGLLGTGLPFVLYNAGVKYMPVSRAAMMLNTIPLFGTSLAVALLGERPTLVQLIGGIAILFAAVGVERS